MRGRARERTTGGKTRYGELAKKRANHSTDSPLDLATRTGQERVRILDRHRKEEKERTENGEEETGLTREYARKKNWSVARGERGRIVRRLRGGGRGFIGSQGNPGIGLYIAGIRVDIEDWTTHGRRSRVENKTKFLNLRNFHRRSVLARVSEVTTIGDIRTCYR